MLTSNNFIMTACRRQVIETMHFWNNPLRNFLAERMPLTLGYDQWETLWLCFETYWQQTKYANVYQSCQTRQWTFDPGNMIQLYRENPRTSRRGRGSFTVDERTTQCTPVKASVWSSLDLHLTCVSIQAWTTLWSQRAAMTRMERTRKFHALQ